MVIPHQPLQEWDGADAVEAVSHKLAPCLEQDELEDVTGLCDKHTSHHDTRTHHDAVVWKMVLTEQLETQGAREVDDVETADRVAHVCLILRLGVDVC